MKYTQMLKVLMNITEDGNLKVQEYSMLMDKSTHGRHLVYSQDIHQIQLNYPLIIV